MNNFQKSITTCTRIIIALSAILLVIGFPAPIQAAAGGNSHSPDVEPYDDGTVYQSEEAPAGLAYYFDSVNGNDANAGTSATTPWKSLTKFNSVVFPAGSTIYLKRGSVWTGAAEIKSNGTAAARIRYTAYGAGALPVFRNPGSTSYYKVAIRIRGDFNIVQFLKLQDSTLAGIYIDEGAEDNFITDVEATNVGEGVNLHGNRNKVLRSYFHDLIMAHNDPGGDDDYGAVGVWLFSDRNEVAFNRMVNCRAPSFDYGEDGGAVELYKKGSGNYIHNNYAYNTKGFMEVGTGTAYVNNIIVYNVIVNSGRILRLHFIGSPTPNIRLMRFENNTVVDTSATGNYMFSFYGDSPASDSLIVRNNIFYLPNYKRITSISNPIWIHKANLYYLPNGTLGFTKDPSEILGDPKFINLAARNYDLQATSPAVNRGINLGFTKDYLSRPVPVGPAPDMGAYERQ